MKQIFFSLGLFLFSYLSPAQIVNVEKKRVSESGFNATFKFNLNISNTGNMLTRIANTTDVQYHNKKSRFIFLNDLSLLRYDGGDLINDGFQHLRYNYTMQDTGAVTWEFFSQHQYNEKKILKRRILLGGGPRFRLVKTEKITWYLAPLVMYEHEKHSDQAQTRTDFIRGDAYTNLSFKISKELSLNHISYYQPKLDELSNYRYSGETGLKIDITEYLAFSSSFALDYDANPPAEIPNLFYYFKNQIHLKF